MISQPRRPRALFVFVLLSLLSSLLFAMPASAWTCGAPIDAREAPDTSRVSMIFLGRIVQVSMVSDRTNDSVQLVGKVAVLETLRGQPKPTQELRYSLPKNFDRVGGPGATNWLDVGKPYLFLSDGSPLSFSNCSAPLRLHPTNIAYGDGCRLYRYRRLLGLTQKVVAACESAQLNGAGLPLGSGPLQQTEYERRELNWKELGIDWRAAAN